MTQHTRLKFLHHVVATHALSPPHIPSTLCTALRKISSTPPVSALPPQRAETTEVAAAMRNQQFHSSPLPLPKVLEKGQRVIKTARPQHLKRPDVLLIEKVPVYVLPTRPPTAALPSTPKAATATAALPSPEPAAEDAAAQPSIQGGPIQEDGHVVAPQPPPM